MSKKAIETELPGIGKKYTINLKGGNSVVVTVHTTGKRELHFMTEEETVAFSLELTEEEAKEIGMALAGAFYEPVKPQKLELVLKEVIISWIKVEKGFTLIDKTIAELQIRKKTGVSVIAIEREGKIIPSPDPYTEKILEGDRLIVVGTREQIKKFQELFNIP